MRFRLGPIDIGSTSTLRKVDIGSTFALHSLYINSTFHRHDLDRKLDNFLGCEDRLARIPAQIRQMCGVALRHWLAEDAQARSRAPVRGG
jgi:hypothetical protein